MVYDQHMHEIIMIDQSRYLDPNRLANLPMWGSISLRRKMISALTDGYQVWDEFSNIISYLIESKCELVYSLCASLGSIPVRTVRCHRTSLSEDRKRFLPCLMQLKRYPMTYKSYKSSTLAGNRSSGLSRGLASSRSGLGRQTVVSENGYKGSISKYLYCLEYLSESKVSWFSWIAEISQRASFGNAEQGTGAANAQVLRECTRDAQKADQDGRGWWSVLLFEILWRFQWLHSFWNRDCTCRLVRSKLEANILSPCRQWQLRIPGMYLQRWNK